MKQQIYRPTMFKFESGHRKYKISLSDKSIRIEARTLNETRIFITQTNHTKQNSTNIFDLYECIWKQFIH
jgi:hypothetical protein